MTKEKDLAVTRIIEREPLAEKVKNASPSLAEKLEALSENDLFWFLRHEVSEDRFFWKNYFGQELHQAQDTVSRSQMYEDEASGKEMRFIVETRGGKEGRLNEDAVLIEQFGKGRMVVAALDGASSQRPIAGLEEHGVSGAFYVSHLAAFGFPTSKVFKELSQKENVTAKEFTIALNTWLYDQMSQIEGVDYNDVLSIPGMAATISIIDLANDNITVAQVADTVGIAHSTSGHWDSFTNNLNSRFDEETMLLVERVAKEKNISIREAAADPRIKVQLAASFEGKINTPTGCGILNGMPELAKYPDLITEYGMDSLAGLHQLVFCSDGALTTFEGDAAGDFLVKLQHLKDIYSANTPLVGDVMTLLNSDPNFEFFPRLKHADDATMVVIELEKLLVMAKERYNLAKLFPQDS
ncbi:MAG: hypothetical protein HN981_02860 [Candidatus Pacebacteria bacterium]|jgi:hypothetical protein|nr:hypothetical protein [Candidatus Paceibacterota bacterium]MBT4652568.1 hypothetical protein [Candidatus Paceibacterota bacterium]MBT6756395.1 hypothetical protein [Candidatus Paceibacterota bacterium]MBT6921311.1 hypothetical protein [Candidatus Paceibacterota bacterium]